jgi:hypothetical protein
MDMREAFSGCGKRDEKGVEGPKQGEGLAEVN